MLIIHNISDFLDELFPKYKKSGHNLDVLKDELIEYYTFSVYRPLVEISEGFVKITIDTQRIENEYQEYQTIVKLCERGDFQKAKPWLESLIKKNPTNSEYYRVLGQIYSDEGNQELAIDTLIDALRWNSKNTYALTMMGNIIAKFREDIPTALKYFNQVVEINPKDNIAINNIGVNLLQQGKMDQAKEYFQKALSIDSDYANTHYGLAIIAEMENDMARAFSSATEALRKSKAKDVLYKQAFNLVVKSAQKLIESSIGEKIFNEYLHKLEFDGDIIIKAVVDDTIPTAAKMELAENYGRDYHLIRYKSDYPSKEHLMIHELVHIQFIIQARQSGVNQLFFSSLEHKRNYITSEEGWLKKMSKAGIPEDALSKVISDLFEGINRQIFNTPIDLFIEDLIYNEFPGLRPFQFLSLFAITKEAIHDVTDKKIVDFSPKTTLYNSKIYNIISALHFKSLYGVDLMDEFHSTQNEFKEAKEMYEEFIDYRNNRNVGEEYELVQNWAEDLKLEKNFILVNEDEYRNKHRDINTIIKDIENDPLGLDSDLAAKDKEMDKFQKSQQKIGINMSVVMYMVDALEYFEKLSNDKIKGIALEIAMIGTQGIKPDQKSYKVASIPHKTFTGYHLLAYYYVSFALAVPERLEMLDLPYKNEYEMAITMRKPPK